MRTTLVIVLLALACALLGAGEPLQYDRVAVHGGEVWRFATASLVHWSWDQLIWDAIAFAALGFVAAKAWPVRFHLAAVASAIAIPVIVHVAVPNVMTYRGLSGIDSALFALVALRLAKQTRSPMFLLCLGGFVLKVGFEVATGSTLFVRELAPGVTAMPLAHVIGGAIGILAALLPELRLQRPQFLGERGHRFLESLHARGQRLSGGALRRALVGEHR